MTLLQVPLERLTEPHRSAGYRSDVQGLRAVAVLAVVIFHAGLPLPGGFVGVDVFFVISGFVITGLLVRQAESGAGIKLGQFWLRRLRRLVPAAALMTLASLVGTALLLTPIGPTQSTAAQAGGSATLFAANAFFFCFSGGYFDPDTSLNPFLHMWSLSVEEQFYVAFPALVLLTLRVSRGSKRVLRSVLAAVLIGSLALSLLFAFASPHLPLVNEPLRFAFYGTPVRAWEFCVGALVALLPSVTRRAATGASSIGAVGLAASLALITEGMVFPGFVVIAPVVATGLLLLHSTGEGSWISRVVLGHAAARWIGDRSYAWYLWHWPLIVFAKALAPGSLLASAGAALLGLLVAAITYTCMERPIHRELRLKGRRGLLLIASCGVLLPAVACGALWQAADHGWWQADIQQTRAIVTPDHADLRAGCAQTYPLGDARRPECISPVQGQAKGKVLLIGDSNAGHFIEPLTSAAHSLGYDSQVVVFGGCPFIQSPRFASTECEDYVKRSAEYLRSHANEFDAIVVSNASVSYVSEAPENYVSASEPDPDRGWAVAMATTLSRLPAELPVVLVGSVPQYGDVPRCLRPSLLSSMAAGCGQMSLANDSYRDREQLIRAESAETAPVVDQYLDTGDTLCDPVSGCSVFVDGTLVYRDGAHLAVLGSMLFADDFELALSKAIGSHGHAQ